MMTRPQPAAARAFWRWLTSMRTALILLLLLAVAAVPGSICRSARQLENVNGYLRAHPSLGPWLDRFSALRRVLLALVLRDLPAAVHLAGRLPGAPAAPARCATSSPSRREAPARLDRLPHSAPCAAATPAAAAAGAAGRRCAARRWRTVVREQPDGAVTVAAEKGYLKETGNLVFHFALLALLVGVALGSWYGWHANRLVVAGPTAFCNTVQQYDEYGLGARVTAARPARRSA